MTPKEKADELFSQFGDKAKYFVSEIKYNLCWLEDSINYDKAFVFWNNVKQEIEKL